MRPPQQPRHASVAARPLLRRRAAPAWLACAGLLCLLLVAVSQHVARRSLARSIGRAAGNSAALLHDDDAPCGAVPSLGFDYPQLRRVRALVASLACEQQQPVHSWQQLTATYAGALAGLQAGGAPAASTGGDRAAAEPLQQLLAEAVALLSAETGAALLRCEPDASLLAAWRQPAQQPSPQPGGGGGGGPTAKAYLLAANLHNSAAVLPNFVVQCLRLALLLPRGRLAVSVYESGSSDTTRLWLTLLHQLLLPLGVPHNITTGGSLAPQRGLPRIRLLAALRNAVLEPWLGQEAQQQQQQLRPSRRPATPGARELSYLGPAGRLTWLPGGVIFVNDVFWCADDALRLALHGASLACGLDFYEAPWMAAGGASGAAPAARRAPAPPPGSAGPGPVVPGSDWRGVGAARDDDDDDDAFDPTSQQLLAGGAGVPPGLRFYDKWVARDASGRRLRNRPPFVRHAPSQAALASGLPVAMACCWNGLAVLDAAPFAAGLRFRESLPGECAASECSLLCDDLARTGAAHVVMDPGVRLAYEAQQLAALHGTASVLPSRPTTTGAAGAAAVLPGLGPRRPWRDVAAASLALAEAAEERHAVRGVGGAAKARARLVECCDLLPGASYVDFRRDCHMADVLAPNFTARVVAAQQQHTTLPH